MLLLSVGLYVPRPGEIYLDEDACSDLVNRLGANLKRLVSLNLENIISILNRAQIGGYIRWHMLWHVLLNAADEPVSSTYRICENTYIVTLTTVDGPGLGSLDERQLCELLQALGDGFNELRKLSVDQVTHVLDCLRIIGILKCSTVGPPVLPPPSTSSVSSEHYGMDPPRPAPPQVKSLPPNGERLHSTVSLSHPAETFDLLSSELQPLTNGQPATPTFNNAECFSPGPANALPWPNGDAISYLTPPCSVNSPSAGRPLIFQSASVSPLGYPSMNTPQSIGTPSLASVASPICAASPGTEAGSMFSPVLSPCPSNALQAARPLILPGSSGVSSPHRRATGTPRSPMDPHQREVVVRMLQSCRFHDRDLPLKERQIHQILRAGAAITTQDPSEMLTPLLRAGPAQSSLDSLGVPEEWEGINGAVNCLRLLDADRDKRNSFTLKPLARRIMQILLYINYEKLRKRSDTDVLNRILDAYVDDPNAARTEQSRKNRFHSFHIRRGKWWWRLAASLGFGILLIAAEDLMNIMNIDTFTNDQMDAFIAFILHCYPGTVELFRSLEPVAISILNGEVPPSFSELIFSDDSGLLSQKALWIAHNNDQQALAAQWTSTPWVVEKSKLLANEKLAQFLAFLDGGA
ncbi:hypothetical protein F9C07_1839838 [Aspergillus flavus]|uniref:Uncharacterized protein n=1 Tax=Aspergillus flavus (strain ATCC 200026 / FGSC A1120 / IAM 13836 / NRRL 3357 / JCM 12722 / SRRC 167) TaxID=332952 RepID=A0A7U2MWW8_ASPFN|nr:hypothetical protein F9C07_1839838 [Aspergillus flavus]RAQ61745.1 hypothetical protein COH20_010115 [Aspergillus flavus]RAQ63314.1 hypothetical protein COH21_008450 [Aspergillus flavus]